MNQKNDIKEVKRLLKLDERTLYSLLSLNESQIIEGLKYSPGQEEERGRKIFSDIKDKLYSQICIDWGYCQKRNDRKYQDIENLIITLLDIIAALTITIPPTLITSILLKIGLDRFCKCK